MLVIVSVRGLPRERPRKSSGAEEGGQHLWWSIREGLVGDVALEMGLDNRQNSHGWNRGAQTPGSGAEQGSHRRGSESWRSPEPRSYPPVQPILCPYQTGPPHLPGLTVNGEREDTV